MRVWSSAPDLDFTSDLTIRNPNIIDLALEQSDNSAAISNERKPRARPPPGHLDPNKMIDLLDLLLLSRLWAKPMGGYELKKEMMSEFGMRLSFGTIYPHLKNLENSRLICLDIEAPNRKRKNVYKLTPEGKSSLKFSAVGIIKIANNLRPILDS